MVVQIRRACLARATSPMLVGVGAASSVPVISLERGVTVIGSKSHSHLGLPGSDVSGAHALLVHINGGVGVFDLLSRTRTFVNGQPVSQASLEEGDVLRIGRFEFEVQPADEADAQRALPRRLPHAPPLRLVRENPAAAVRVAAPVVLVGRRAGAGLVLDDRHVSSAHAAIIEGNGRRFIYDLNSRYGTFVNGERVRRRPIAPGDVVRIGNTVLRCEEDVADAPGSDELAAPRELAGNAAPADDAGGESSGWLASPAACRFDDADEAAAALDDSGLSTALPQRASGLGGCGIDSGAFDVPPAAAGVNAGVASNSGTALAREPHKAAPAAALAAAPVAEVSVAEVPERQRQLQPPSPPTTSQPAQDAAGTAAQPAPLPPAAELAPPATAHRPMPRRPATVNAARPGKDGSPEAPPQNAPRKGLGPKADKAGTPDRPAAPARAVASAGAVSGKAAAPPKAAARTAARVPTVGDLSTAHMSSFATAPRVAMPRPVAVPLAGPVTESALLQGGAFDCPTTGIVSSVTSGLAVNEAPRLGGAGAAAPAPPRVRPADPGLPGRPAGEAAGPARVLPYERPMPGPFEPAAFQGWGPLAAAVADPQLLELYGASRRSGSRSIRPPAGSDPRAPRAVSPEPQPPRRGRRAWRLLAYSLLLLSLVGCGLAAYWYWSGGLAL